MSAHRVPVDRKHQFVVSRRGYVSVLPKQPSGESFADCRYEFEVAGKVEKGIVGASGVISHAVPRRARKAELRIWDSVQPDDKPLVWLFELGDRPPVSTFEGVRWRLENLGFDCGGEQREGPKTRAAVRAFEAWIGLKSAEEEFQRDGKLSLESPITDKVRDALDEVYNRPAGLHHGVEFRGDDEVEETPP